MALVVMSCVVAGRAQGQERNSPTERHGLELGVNAAGLRGDAFSDFGETRLLVGGTALAGPWGRWSIGVGMDVWWVDHPATTYLYSALAQRAFGSIRGFEPFLAMGVGGRTTRLDVPGVRSAESDWIVPIVAGARWRADADSRWGVRAALTDLVVWEEVPCGCVNIGGPEPETGDTTASHNLGVSMGLFVRLGGSP